MKNILKSVLISFGSLLGISSCVEATSSVKVVQNFQLERYLGTWYEIARLNHSFERNLSDVTATYSINSDGNVKVVNKGYNERNKTWSESVGKAKFVESKNIGSLKVSFFGPFYGAYKIVVIDANYQYAMVVSKGTKYLWFLSRQKSMPESIKQEYLKTAKDLGFSTENLIWVTHE